MKAELLLAGNELLGVDALNPGHGDLAFGLDFLRGGAKKHNLPYVSANLADADGKPVFPATVIVERGGLKIGITGILPAKPLPGGTVLPVTESLANALASLKADEPDLIVLLSNLGLAEDKKLASTMPGFDLIFGSDRRHQEQPAIVGQTAVFQAGSRGKHVGQVVVELTEGRTGWAAPGARLTAMRQAESIDRQIARYEGLMASADAGQKERYEKALAFARQRRADLVIPEPDDGSANKLEASQVAMNRDLADEPKMLALVTATLEQLGDSVSSDPHAGHDHAGHDHGKAPPKPDHGDWVGMDSCRGCHPVQFADWRETGHAHAWSTLVKTKRHMDLQCWSCHVTGAHSEDGPQSPKETGGLQNVQCEACHGPGREHVANPAKVKPVRTPGPEVCLACHTEEQTEGRFDYAEYLPRVDHKP